MPKFSSNDLPELKEALRQRDEALVRDLFAGSPIQVKAREIRIGTNGSLAICRRKGVYYDHKSGDSGDLLELIRKILGFDFPGTVEWARAWVGGVAVEQLPIRELRTAKSNWEEREAKRQKAFRAWQESIPLSGGDHAGC